MGIKLKYHIMISERESKIMELNNESKTLFIPLYRKGIDESKKFIYKRFKGRRNNK